MCFACPVGILDALAVAQAVAPMLPAYVAQARKVRWKASAPRDVAAWESMTAEAMAAMDSLVAAIRKNDESSKGNRRSHA